MPRTRRLLEALERKIFLDTVVETTTVGPFSPSHAATTFAVPQFDNQNGTRRLLSVEMNLVLTSRGGATGLENEGPGTGSATVTIGTDVNVERDWENHGDGVWDVELSATESETNANVQADSDAAPDYLYPNDDDSVVVAGTTAQDEDSKTWTDPADILPFIGSGTVDIYYESFPNNSSDHTIGSGTVQTVTVQADSFTIDVTITYTYDVPELELVKGVIATNGPGTFTRKAGPVTFTAPGSAGVRFSGTISSTALDSRTVDANLLLAEPGDLVSFGIVIENVGGGTNGAYDVRVRDTIPNGMSIPPGGLNLTVTDGTGAAVAYTELGTGLFDSTGGIELTDPGPTSGSGAGGVLDVYHATSGRNVVVITYDLKVDSDIWKQTPQASVRKLIDTATVYNYAGYEGGTDLSVADLTDRAYVTLLQYHYDWWDRYEWGTWEEFKPAYAQAFAPLYSGTAEPGATLSVEIYDAQGNLIGSKAAVVDAGGNWLANFPDTAMTLQPHYVLLRQTYAGYSPLADAGYNLRTYYSRALLGGGTFVSEQLTVENVLARRSVGSLEALYAAGVSPITLGWHAFAYEMLCLPAVPGGY